MQVRKIELRRGGLQDIANAKFLAKGGTMKVFFNNYNGLFGSRAMKQLGSYSLDDCMVGLFGCMPEGSMLVTTWDLSFFVSIAHGRTWSIV